jgi:hypothetical protein
VHQLICHWSKPSTLLHVYLFLSKLLESCFTRSIIRDGFAKHVCQPRRQDLAPPRRELQQSMSQMASSNWCRRQESLSRDSVDEDAAAAAYASACREVGRDPVGRKDSSQYRGVSLHRLKSTSGAVHSNTSAASAASWRQRAPTMLRARRVWVSARTFPPRRSCQHTPLVGRRRQSKVCADSRRTGSQASHAEKSVHAGVCHSARAAGI